MRGDHIKNPIDTNIWNLIRTVLICVQKDLNSTTFASHNKSTEFLKELDKSDVSLVVGDINCAK